MRKQKNSGRDSESDSDIEFKEKQIDLNIDKLIEGCVQSVQVATRNEKLLTQMLEYTVIAREENKQLLGQVIQTQNQLAHILDKKLDLLENKKEILEREGEVNFELDRDKLGNNQSIAGPALSNNSYLNDFFLLGGKELKFNPKVPLHPVAYIKKLKELFNDAAGPESKQLRLALLGLKGSAAEWGDDVENKIKIFYEFEGVFLDKYWSTETQRDVHDRLKFGRWSDRFGSRVSYFKTLTREVNYLSTTFTERKLIDLLVNHKSA